MALPEGYHPGRVFLSQDGDLYLNGKGLVATDGTDLLDPDTNVPTLAALPTGAPAGAGSKWLRVFDEDGNAYLVAAWDAV
jgi:hypothetical protein